MTKVDLLAALNMLPRWTRSNYWRVDGKKCMTNAQECPTRIAKLIHKMMDSVFDCGFPRKVEWVDVSGKNIWVFHRSLKVPHLMWLYRRGWSWQKWPARKLPIYVRYAGKLVIWNGTHRMTLARLAGRKVRARVYDIDKYMVWRKSHRGEDYDANVK